MPFYQRLTQGLCFFMKKFGLVRLKVRETRYVMREKLTCMALEMNRRA
jgi:hypothetical protein